VSPFAAGSVAFAALAGNVVVVGAELGTVVDGGAELGTVVARFGALDWVVCEVCGVLGELPQAVAVTATAVSADAKNGRRRRDPGESIRLCITGHPYPSRHPCPRRGDVRATAK
jgi:hypothetical protein